MNSPILERHQQLLAQWLDGIKSGEKSYDGETWFEPVLQWTKDGKLTANHVRNDYEKDSGKYSFINRFREFIQKENGLNLPYEEAISIISEIFVSEFEGKRFFQAEQKIIQRYPIDMTNATAEWRAYFEYRFRNPITDFFALTFPEHWLSTNISLYSFWPNKHSQFIGHTLMCLTDTTLQTDLGKIRHGRKGRLIFPNWFNSRKNTAPYGSWLKTTCPRFSTLTKALKIRRIWLCMKLTLIPNPGQAG